MEWEVWHVWLGVCMALVMLEVFVPGFVLACLGVGALAGSCAAALGWGLTAQLVTVGVASLLAFVFLRPVALGVAQSDATKTGVDALVGRPCKVTQAFDDTSRLGRCKVDGDDWRAELSDRSSIPQVNDVVWVERVESNTLVVSTKPLNP